MTVVIPVLNEELHIAEAIAATRSAGACEIIVVDGGSTDGTVARATGADRVISSLRGRAVQMNAGAAQAQGEILLFLHADCRLPSGFPAAVAAALVDSQVVGGCFSQKIDSPRGGYRLIEQGNAARVRLFGWIYGDQAPFVRKEAFDRLGGFPEVPLMEDLAFSKRLRRLGRLVVVQEKLQVDPRRWEHDGMIRRTVLNWLFILLAGIGVPLSTLAAWYGHVRSAKGRTGTGAERVSETLDSESPLNESSSAHVDGLDRRDADEISVQ